jgi:amidohydrolase
MKGLFGSGTEIVCGSAELGVELNQTETEEAVMPDTLRAVIHQIEPEMIETRRYLHQNPELSFHEEKTAALVAERLRQLGLTVQTGVGGHGVVATLQGARPGRTLAIRADMDALPIQEQSSLPYCSRSAGVMHACGHDGHTTILLGTAKALTTLREEIAGSVRFIFQPAEEVVGGAHRMCEAGVMEGVDAVIALHGWPQIGVGQIGVRSGAMMASADTFDIRIQGQGAHAAYPHLSVDPIVVGAQVVTALQTLVSRETDPNDPVVVTVGQFHAGTAYNIIPATAHLAGTVRTLSNETRRSMPARIRRVVEGVCAAARASCEFVYQEGTPAVINDPGINDLIAEVGRETLGEENVLTIAHPSMGAEDFAVYLNYAPGAMFRLGLGETSPIHTPTFDFEDRALAIGVELFCRVALRYLNESAGYL